jgi:ribosomal protein S12 methylthiotransferase
LSSIKFYIDGHGCAKNQVDGEEIAARLEAAGHVWVQTAEEADLLLVNSCGFIDDAKKESIDAVFGWKAQYPDKKVLLMGCLAQRYAKDLAGELSEADGIVGNTRLEDAVGAAEAVMAGERPVIARSPESTAPSVGGPEVRRSRLLDFPGTAHVKITEGCSNRCTYCAIPLIRGPLHSRSVSEVVAECAWLIGRGIHELNLVGQDLGSYGRDLGPSGGSLGGERLLPELLAGLSALKGDFRARVLYIHPDFFPEEILPIMAADPRLLPYFDIPFQHASEPILRAMNRHGTAAGYLSLLERIRKALPDAVLRTTFLLGFPGESDADFEALRAFQEEARFDWLGAFAYSREEGTPAYSMKGRVPKKLVAERKAAIEEAQERISPKRLERFVGRELEILVEEPFAKTEGEEDLSFGRAWLQAPDVDGLTVLRGAFEAGSLVKAKVLALKGMDFDALPL